MNRILNKYTFLMLFGVGLCISSNLDADTIRFKNGYEIYGTAVLPGEVPSIPVKEGYIRVMFKNGGWFEFPATDVEFLIRDERDIFEERK